MIAARRTIKYKIPGKLLAGEGPVRVLLRHEPVGSTEQRGGPDEQQHALCVHQLQLFETPPKLEIPDLETSCGLSLSDFEQCAGISADKFISQFESLGEDCEFGLVQRYCGAEPLGLFRFGAPRLRRLIECIENRLENTGAPEHIELVMSNNDPREYIVRETMVGMAYHTWQYEGSIDPAHLLSQQSVRLRLLARKLLEDFSDGKKIFVWKSSNYPAAISQVQQLHDTLNRFAPTTLLWVVQAEPAKPSGTAELLRPGLVRAYIHGFSATLPDVEMETWLLVCLNGYRVAQSSPSLASGYPCEPAALAEWTKGEQDNEIATPTTVPLLAHIQNQGDTISTPEGWVGEPGSGLAIEGFAMTEDIDLPRLKLSYQVVLRDGSLSHTYHFGKFCGTRGENTPIYGFLIRYDPAGPLTAKVTYEATFIDGTRLGPLPAGTECRASSQSPLEAFRVTLTPIAS